MPNWGSRKAGNSKFVKFRGKAVYVKPYIPDEYNGVQNWKCGMTVTKEEFEKVKESGCQMRKKFAENVPNIDEGTPYIVFKRPTEKVFKDGTTYFCPPKIIDANQDTLVSYKLDGKEVYQFTDPDNQPEREGDPILIGNGSDIEVTVCIYPAGSFGKGTRLESIKVIDLIEYTPEDKSDDSEEDNSEKDEEVFVEGKSKEVKSGNMKAKIDW